MTRDKDKHQGMRNQKLNYVLVGLFVLAMVVAVVAAALMLSRRTTAQDSYIVVFDNVADIKLGAVVRFEGYPVGQVSSISPVHGEGRLRFELHLGIEKGWAVPKDSIARIASSNFLAAKTIDIEGGRDTKSLLSPGDKIDSAAPVDMLSIMADVAAEFGDLSRNDIRALIAGLSELVSSANGLLNKDLRKILGSVDGMARNLEQQGPAITGQLLKFSSDLNIVLEKLQRLVSDNNAEGVENIIGNVEKLTLQLGAVGEDAQITMAQMNTAIARIDALLSEGNIDSMQRAITSVETGANRLAEISSDAKATLKRFDGILDNVASVVDNNDEKVTAAIESARYTLDALARNIDSINHNIDGAARNMNEFSRLIRQNPGLLLDSRPRGEVRDTAPKESGATNQ